MREISVIVPVYNAERYLKESIESILGQEDIDFELILIEAESEDGSGAICDRYATEYENVHVVHQKNEGISAARNTGIRLAYGKYLVFVDSDDYLPEKSTLKHMYHDAEESGVDIVVGEYARLWDGELLPAASHSAFSGDEPSGADFRFKGFFSVGTLSYVWGKLYRREFLKEQHISFARYQYAEDKLFNILCYSKGAVYGFCERQSYVYRKNDESVSFTYRKDSEKGWMRLAQQLQDELECAGKENEMDLVGNIIFFACFFDAKMEYEFQGKTGKAAKGMLKRYATYPLARKYFADFVRGRYIREISSKLWKFMIWGFCFGMNFHMYGLLALGIKLLIELKIDERLSDTGKRDKKRDKRKKKSGDER